MAADLVHKHGRIWISFGVIISCGVIFFAYAKNNVTRNRYLEMKRREKLREELAELAKQREATKNLEPPKN